MTSTRPGSQDSLYATPYIDVDEWRDAPVRHRYVHGGFEGTEARFSFYFPPAEQYEGRFFQPLPAMVGNEHLAMAPGARLTVDFAVASGAYLVESNLGWDRTRLVYDDNTIHGYRASAAAARYSRVVASEMYGQTPSLRLLLRRKRRRVAHPRLPRELRRVGRWGAVHPSTPGDVPGHALGRRARDPAPPPQGRRHHRRARPGRQRRHVRRTRPPGTRRPRDGHAARVPTASAVLHRGHRAHPRRLLVRVRPTHARRRPAVLRGLLDGPRVPRRRGSDPARRPCAAEDHHRVGRHGRRPRWDGPRDDGDGTARRRRRPVHAGRARDRRPARHAAGPGRDAHGHERRRGGPVVLRRRPDGWRHGHGQLPRPARGRRGGRRGGPRQRRPPRVPDLPPPPGRSRLPRVGPVLRRRTPDVPAARRAHGPAPRPRGRRLELCRTLRREDDRRPEPDGRRGVAQHRGLLPGPGRIAPG